MQISLKSDSRTRREKLRRIHEDAKKSDYKDSQSHIISYVYAIYNSVFTQ